MWLKKTLLTLVCTNQWEAAHKIFLPNTFGSFANGTSTIPPQKVFAAEIHTEHSSE